MSTRHAKHAKHESEALTGFRLPEDSEAVLRLLSSGEIELKGRLRWSSNATFLVAVHPPGGNKGAKAKPHNGPARNVSEDGADGSPMLAIYKPTRGERPLWDFPRGLWKREVAAYELASALGWEIVPPTVARLMPLWGPARFSTASTRSSKSTISPSSKNPATTSLAAWPPST